MTDSQAFEARFVAAYRRYLAEASTQVDAAEVARAVAASPRARVLPRWPVVLRPSGALAWLLLTLLLVAALAASAFMVGSWQHSLLPPLHSFTSLPLATPSTLPSSTSPTPSPTLSPSSPVTSLTYKCPPGTNPDVPGPIDQKRPADANGGGITVDSRAGLLIWPDGAVAAGPPWPSAPAAIWTFDLCTNTWRMSAASVAKLGDGGATVYDSDSGLTVVIGSSSWAKDSQAVRIYDSLRDKAKIMAPAPVSGRWQAVYDSQTGLILARDRQTSRLWTYDVDTDAWTEVHQTGDLPYFGTELPELLAYDSAVDRLVLYVGGSGTYEFDLIADRWTHEQIYTPHVSFAYSLSRSEMTYDAVWQRSVVISGGSVFAYDARVHAWQTVLEEPDQVRTLLALAFDPGNQRIVVLGGGSCGRDRQSPCNDVRAFDPASGSWMTLLEQQL